MPPKKDAFADLFSSASNGSKSNKMSLLERQKHQQKHQQKQQNLQSLSSALSVPTTDSFSNLDFLSNRPSREQSSSPSKSLYTGVMTPNLKPMRSATPSSVSSNSSTKDDPFAIFEKKQRPLQHTSSSRNGQSSLLDDDFTDSFTAPAESSTPPVPSGPSTSVPSRPSSSAKSVKKDSVVAELVDIGFSIEDANMAIREKGTDLQACVNYIMNKHSESESTQSRNQSGKSDGIDFNELGMDIFNRANKFLAKSKQTVMKNLEQLNQGSSRSSSDLPEWMKNQDKYKKDAIEKKYGGDDYGSDSENLNHDDIQRFMQIQKEKDRERAKQRISNIKETAFSKILGKEDERRSPEAQENTRRETRTRDTRTRDTRTRDTRTRDTRNIRDTRNTSENTRGGPERTERTESLYKETYRSKPIPAKQPSAKQESVERPIETRPESKPASVKPVKSPVEVDLLGISSDNSKSLKSSLRDNSPLNQFDENDYTRAKDAAQAAYKAGDYSGARDQYLVCFNKLASDHELRVVILSNLGTVNKQLGNLKESLQNADNALALIGEDEINNGAFTINQKPVKYWYTKLISIKAEVCELMEKYEQSLEYYLILIKDLGVVDKKIMDGKRRVDKIINPENYKVKQTTSAPTKPSIPKPVSSAPKANAKKDDEVDPLVQDQINERVKNWSEPKQGNMRALLTGLDAIIPPSINMKPALRNLTTNELMLSKQVKLQYMKVISSIHPDKLASQCKDNKEAELICKAVFIILNETWEKFKAEEGI